MMSHSSTPPRVLFVGAFPPPDSRIFGGMVSSCTTLMASSFAKRLSIIMLDTTQRSVPPPSVGVRLLDAMRRLVRFRSLLRDERPDSVLLFAAPGLSFLEKGVMALMASRRGARAVLAPRGGELMEQFDRVAWFRLIGRSLLGHCAAIICQGPTWQRFLAHRMGVPSERLPVIENWTASTALLQIGAARHPVREQVGLLFLGWLHEDKGVFELLDAFASLRQRRPELRVRLTLAGDGAAASEASARADRMQLTDVSFTGWVAGDAKLALLAEHEVFVLPSHFEGFPNALVETMAAGLAPVVTPVGAIPDVIVDGVNGILVPVRNVEALSLALERVVAEHALRERIGAAAQRDAMERFGVERAVDQLVLLLSPSGAGS
jgi:glycosyltransferase involved in cell wall biosynthesis